ncbi:MAG TPA: sensor histidine kinase [Friedmanniella sp.]
MSEDTTAPRRPHSTRSAFWAHARRLWSLFFYAIVAIIAAATLVTSGTRGEKVASLVCLALLVLAYTVVGRHAATTGRRAWANAYLAALVVLTVAQVGFDNLGAALLFVSYSQIWFFAEKRWQGVTWTAVLSVGVAARFGIQAAQEAANPLPVVGELAVALVFSIALGLWVTRIAEQSEERAELVRQLEAAQHELAATHHAAGVVAERERLAQEIHDTLAQGFTSVVMLAQTTAAELDRGHEEAARGRIEQIEQVARQNLAEARALVAAFGPADLQDATLAEALARLVERFTTQTGVAVSLTAGTQQAASGLSREAQVVLLRSAQEAMANVRRHAGATRVTLGLVRDDGSVRLEVTDNGRGFGPDAVEGQGLRGMRERARAGGGDLVVDSAPGSGTRLTLTAPLAEQVAP